ncbi:MAG: DUF2254 domain-containing protein [Deltaproteobacteria bacterium]|nr:DUF2254 domain-containing protein [Deltaproteobacteria bacterium]
MSGPANARGDLRLRLRQLRDQLRSSLWIAPALASVVAIAAAVLLVRLDGTLEQDRHDWFLFDGGPDSARALLSTITSSMLTFTALVFSITVLVLQLASSQFSPRVIRSFLRERATKWAMSAFVGTFVYSMVLLSQVRTEPAFVPAVATWFALLLVLVSVGVFIHYIHSMAHSIRAISVISKIAAETRHVIARVFPEALAEVAPEVVELPAGPPRQLVLHTGAPGVLAFVDTERLVAIATRGDAVLEVVPCVGSFLVTGAPLFRVWGAALDEDDCLAAIGTEIEPTMEQDPAFGLRQLVDIAVRALSPGINDPTTAVQALDHLHDLIRRLTVRAFPARVRGDRDGVPRVIAAKPEFQAFVTLAFEEIRLYGATSTQVVRRLRSALQDIAAQASGERRQVLEQELRALEQARE